MSKFSQLLSCFLFFHTLALATTPNFVAVPDFTITPSSVTICPGQTVTLTANPIIVTAPVEYHWSTGDMTQMIDVSPSVTTTYSVTLTGGTPTGPNLIPNGTFNGSIGPAVSDYVPGSGGTWGVLSNEGTYAVGTNPNALHSNFSGCSMGTGNMMVVNGSNTAGINVWCQTVTVQKNTKYQFKFQLMSVISDNPANMSVIINGVQVGPNLSAGAPCQVLDFVYDWFSGSTTSAQICLVNQNTAASGNDFALDNMVFRAYDKETFTAKVTIKTPPTVSVLASICQGASYTLPDGTVVTTPGNFPVVLKTPQGCDSTVITKLTVKPSPAKIINIALCTGQSLTLPNGNVVSAAGNYTSLIPSTTPNTCDTIATYKVVLKPSPTKTVNIILCEGSSFILPNGNTVTTAGQYSVTIVAAIPNTCDTLAKYNIAVKPTKTGSIAPSICDGDSYTLPNGTKVSVTGQYIANLIAKNGCDSTLTINLTIKPKKSTSINKQICQGDSYNLPDGTKATQTKIYTFKYSIVNACDSTFLVNLKVNPTYSKMRFDTICSNAIFTLPNGIKTNKSGTYTSKFSTKENCDSTIITNLTVWAIDTIKLDTAICEGLSYTLPDGKTASVTGIYSVKKQNIHGCDRWFITNLTIKKKKTKMLNPEVCIGTIYTLPDGKKVTQTGVYVTILVAKNGCDSTITTILTVKNQITKNIDVALCQGESYTLADGMLVSVAGNYSVTLTSVNGCDSTIITHLTYNNLATKTVNTSICEGESYTLPNGMKVNKTGFYPVSLKTSKGCDSILTTNLTVKLKKTGDLETTICQGVSYTLPDGKVVSSQGNYTVKLVAKNGCDSLLTVKLNVVSSITKNVAVTICQGTTYTLPDGKKVTTAGTYNTLLKAVGGCDSLVVTKITLNSVITKTVQSAICEGEVYTLPDGKQVNTSGTYVVTLSVPNACDTTINTTLVVYKKATKSVQKTICQGETLVLPDGKVVSQAGVYTLKLQTSKGCDSVFTTNVLVFPIITSNVKAQICANSSYTLPDGKKVSKAGTYSSKLIHPTTSCDSIVVTTLTVVDTIKYFLEKSLCFGETFKLNNKTYNQTGIYSNKGKSVSGCDSLFQLKLTILPQIMVQIEGDTLLQKGASDTLSAHILSLSNDIKNYIWTPSAPNSSAIIVTPDVTTLYKLKVVSKEGCSASNTLTVQVREPHHVYIPNAFSPHDYNGHNDFFGAVCGTGVAKIIFFKVFDRWGEELFSALNFQPNDPRSRWDGTFRGVQSNQDVYVYVLQALFTDGTTALFQGDVTLMK